MRSARIYKPKKSVLKLRHKSPQYDRRQRTPGPAAPIPEDTRIFVWLRDGGQCRHCGSKVDLQFDHVIPESWGGSGTAENVELLCGKCNQLKGARLHVPGRPLC